MNLIRIDTVRARAFDGERLIHLRFGEYRLLAYLVHAGGPVSGEGLRREVFGIPPKPMSNTLTVTLSRLRSALGNADMILTRAGAYEWVGDAIIQPRL